MQSAGLSADLSAVVESLSVGILKTDEEGVIVYANAAAERALGVSRAQLLHRSARDFIHELDDFERQGRWIRAEVTTLEPGFRLIQLHDVTVRKHSDMALEANQEFLQAVLDTVDAGIVACDAAGTLKLFNR